MPPAFLIRLGGIAARDRLVQPVCCDIDRVWRQLRHGAAAGIAAGADDAANDHVPGYGGTGNPFRYWDVLQMAAVLADQ